MEFPLVFLHGALGAASQLDPLVKGIDRQQKANLNFPGHAGISLPSGDMTVDNLTEWLAEQITETSDIFGYSMGGYVALKLALTHPHKVNRIFTLGTKLDWNPEGLKKELKMLNPQVIKEKVPKFAAALEARHAPLDWEKVLEQTAGLMTDLAHGTALTKSDFERIAHRVCICRGAVDEMVTLEESQQVADWLSNGYFLELADTRHPIEKVDVGQLTQEVHEFFG